MSASLPAFATPFATRDFRRLWIGAFLSSIGTWTQDVALSWWIHTHMVDPVYLGLRSFASDTPLIAFMVIGGAAADRFDRRRILVTSNLIQMSMAACLALLYVTGHLGIAAILAIAFFTGLAQSQSAPTYQSVLTSIVPAPEIPRAVALNSLQFNLSRAIGPVIAGLFLAGLGAGACFVANVFSFVAVIFALYRIDLGRSSDGTSKESLRQSLGAGARFLMASPQLSALTFLAAAGSFLAFPLTTYLPVLAGDVFHTGATGYSLLLTSFGAGAIVGALTTAHRGRFDGRGRALLAAFLIFAAASVGAVLSGRQEIAMVLLPIAGASLTTAFSTINSLVQELSPPAMKGRILGLYGLAFRGGMPLGSLVAGAIGSRVGVPVVLASFCAILAVLSTALYLRRPVLRAL
jgi:MFS family permease